MESNRSEPAAAAYHDAYFIAGDCSRKGLLLRELPVGCAFGTGCDGEEAACVLPWADITLVIDTLTAMLRHHEEQEGEP